MMAKIFIGMLTLAWYLCHIPTTLRIWRARHARYAVVHIENGYKKEATLRRGTRKRTV